MRSMFETGFNRNFFWMGNGGRGGGHPVGWREEEREWPERYCDPSVEWCPTPLVGPVPYPPVGAFAMGQAAYGSVPSGSLTEDQKNQVYALLKDAVAKGTEVDTWIHSAGEGGQRTAMGGAFDQFRNYVNYAADLAETAWPIYQRLGTDNPEDWWILDGDENKVVEFVNAINGAYQLYSAKVKNAPAPAPAPLRQNPAKPMTAPPPAARPTPGTKTAAKPILAPAAPAISPLAIGVGAAAIAALIVVAVS